MDKKKLFSKTCFVDLKFHFKSLTDFFYWPLSIRSVKREFLMPKPIKIY